MKKILAVAVLLALASGASATIYQWDGTAGNGLWSGGNWTVLTFSSPNYVAGAAGQSWTGGTNNVAWFTGSASVNLGGAAPAGTFSSASGSSFATGNPSAFWFNTANQTVSLSNGSINAKYFKSSGVTTNLTLNNIALTSSTGTDFSVLNSGVLNVTLGDLSGSAAAALTAGAGARFIVSSGTNLGAVTAINGALEATGNFTTTAGVASGVFTYTNGNNISVGNATYTGSSASRNQTVEGTGTLTVADFNTTGTGGTAWTKAGTGTLAINGAFNINNAAGATFAVSAGKLLLNGNTTSDLVAVTVSNNGILGGKGVAAGNATIDGGLELDVTDGLAVNGLVTVGAAAKLYLVGTPALTAETPATLLTWGSWNNAKFAQVFFNGLDVTADAETNFGGQKIEYTATGINLVAVPEPATVGLLVVGGIAGLIRRRK